MEKPKDREETAEWIAEDVLGFVIDNNYLPNKNWEKNGILWNQEAVINFIYSPDGLFAVIVKTKTMNGSPSLCQGWLNFLHDQDYQAFYDAVWEVRNGNTEKS